MRIFELSRSPVYSSLRLAGWITSLHIPKLLYVYYTFIHDSAFQMNNYTHLFIEIGSVVLLVQKLRFMSFQIMP